MPVESIGSSGDQASIQWRIDRGQSRWRIRNPRQDSDLSTHARPAVHPSRRRFLYRDGRSPGRSKCGPRAKPIRCAVAWEVTSERYSMRGRSFKTTSRRELAALIHGSKPWHYLTIYQRRGRIVCGDNPQTQPRFGPYRSRSTAKGHDGRCKHSHRNFQLR